MAHNEALKLENEFLKKKMSEKASGEKEVNDIKAKYDQMLKMREVIVIIFSTCVFIYYSDCSSRTRIKN